MSFFPFAFLLAAGCGNYEFQDVRRPDGRYELLPLVRDLEEKKPEPLVGMLWIPLIHADITGFSRERERRAPEDGGGSRWNPSMNPAAGGWFPPGYRLAEWTSWGPLFFHWSARDSLHDLAGAGYEVVEARGVLGRLWSRTRTTVRAARGTRVEVSHAILFGLVPIHHRITYSGAEPPGGGLEASALATE